MPPKFSKELNTPIIFEAGLDFQTRTSPCEANCPAGNPIQKMNELINNHNLEEALEYIHTRNPLPGITGRVCNHPCENACNRNSYDQGISIRALERYVSDHAEMPSVARPGRREKDGKKVAIVGSGPAGLTCAYFSALFGHDVTVFEGSSVLGGMPRGGIPDYRLPKYIIDREIGHILEMGIDVKTNTVIGRDIDFNKLTSLYDACLIATGAWKEKSSGRPNEQFAVGGLSFLRQVNDGKRDPIGGKVVIIGGGGVAFDCALVAKRLDASEIHVICVEEKENMVATPEDVEQADKEGIIVHNGCMASNITVRDDCVTGIEYSKVDSYQFDSNGKLSITFSQDKKKTLAADTVILAVGLAPDLGFTDNKCEISDRGTAKVNPEYMSTSTHGIFAAGDAVLGIGTVAQAIGSGRRAAVGIHHYLSGSESPFDQTISISDDRIVEFTNNGKTTKPHVVEYEEMLDVESYEKSKRCATQLLDPSESVNSFEEIDKGIQSVSDAEQEAGRCFHCGHCQLCGKCVELCPGYVLEMTDAGPRVAFPDECWHCGGCRTNCPSSCIYYEFPVSMLL